MISFICSSKYSSSILRKAQNQKVSLLLDNRLGSAGGFSDATFNLSASSRIRISMCVSSKLGVLWRWSISRPGVAIRTSGPALNAASWDFRSNPPGETGYTKTRPGVQRQSESRVRAEVELVLLSKLSYQQPGRWWWTWTGQAGGPQSELGFPTLW